MKKYKLNLGSPKFSLKRFLVLLILGIVGGVAVYKPVTIIRQVAVEGDADVTEEVMPAMDIAINILIECEYFKETYPKNWKKAKKYKRSKLSIFLSPEVMTWGALAATQPMIHVIRLSPMLFFGSDRDFLATLGHEFLHIVDTPIIPSHNEMTEENVMLDGVYATEYHCFYKPDIIKQLEEEYEHEEANRSIDFEPNRWAAVSVR